MSDILAPIPLFAKLSADERMELAALLQTRKFPPHRPVVWIGEQGDAFYIVQAGRLTVSAPDEAGKEVTLGSLGPGHFFGEISLLDGGPRTATVRTLTDATLLSLEREPFLAFLRKHPDASIHMLTILGQRQRDTMEKLRGIRNVNEAVAEKRTRWQFIAERIAAASASEWFISLNLVLFGGWVLLNLLMQPMLHREPFDAPPSFSVLGFLITVEALFISLFVLISQAQQGERDRIRADLDYQVNLKAHQEVMQLHQKMDKVQAALAATMSAVPSGVRTTAAEETLSDDAG